MKEQFARTEMLLGEEGLEKLHNARVAVFGVGGVGGFVVEALARVGVGCHPAGRCCRCGFPSGSNGLQ